MGDVGDPEPKPPDLLSLFNKNQKFNTKFVIASLDHNEKTFNNFNPIKLCKFFKGYGPGVKVKFLRNGTVLLEINNEKDLLNINNHIKSYEGIPIKFSVNKFLNYSKGVITCFELTNCSEEDILNELTNQGVIEVKRIYKKQNGNKVPTRSLILVFENSKLPEYVNFDFLRVKVRPYDPLPIQCFNCYKFRHFSKNCSVKLCGRCGEGAHEENSICEGEQTCINCGDKIHPAWSKSCPVYKKEKEIEKIRIQDKVTYKQAESLYNERFNNQPESVVSSRNISSSSFANVASSPNVTDILSQQIHALTEAVAKLTHRLSVIENGSAIKPPESIPNITSNKRQSTNSTQSDISQSGKSPKQKNNNSKSGSSTENYDLPKNTENTNTHTQNYDLPKNTENTNTHSQTYVLPKNTENVNIQFLKCNPPKGQCLPPQNKTEKMDTTPILSKRPPTSPSASSTTSDSGSIKKVKKKGFFK